MIRKSRPTVLRFVEDIVARLSSDRVARGEEPLPAHDLRTAIEKGPEHVERTVLSYALGLGAPRFTLEEAAERAGLQPDGVLRLWMAFGFARPVRPDKVFTRGDLAALAEVRRVLDQAQLAEADVLQLARLVGRSLARVSDAAVGVLASPAAGIESVTDEDTATAVRVAAAAGTGSFATMEHLLVYAWKRHLGAAIRRAAAGESGAPDVQVCVGFADITGFTALSDGLDHHTLGRLLDAFHIAADAAVAGRGGRIVKTIGDEIMFVVESAKAAVDIGLRLADGFHAAGRLIQLHVGVAQGPALQRDGDYYGATVNRAKRLAEAAGPGQVFADEDVVAAVEPGRRSSVVMAAVEPGAQNRPRADDTERCRDAAPG